MDGISKTFVIIGTVLIFFGLIWHVTDGKIPFGRLPGDIRIETENTKVFIPVTTSLIISAVLSVLAYIFRKF